ncbi:MAG TPA: polysaccharide biosynthesis/export family protein [Gammaproteobacteria bacterium]|nr:polysaccharide biosynthesis/export family protein [Gammaproteobacteria bacterium]
MKIRRLRDFINLGILLMLMGTLPACAHDQPIADAQCHGEGCRADHYVIGPGDVLHISVWKDASLERIDTVRPDGMISFPLINEIQASGQSPMQLQKTIADRLRQYMNDPEVSVVVQEVHSFAVSVLGEVKTPGRYELKNQATVLDVLAQAGGLSEFASPSKIVILRDDNGVQHRILFDYNTAVYGDQPPFYVHPGDIITVP